MSDVLEQVATESKPISMLDMEARIVNLGGLCLKKADGFGAIEREECSEVVDDHGNRVLTTTYYRYYDPIRSFDCFAAEWLLGLDYNDALEQGLRNDELVRDRYGKIAYRYLHNGRLKLPVNDVLAAAINDLSKNLTGVDPRVGREGIWLMMAIDDRDYVDRDSRRRAREDDAPERRLVLLHLEDTVDPEWLQISLSPELGEPPVFSGTNYPKPSGN